MSCFTCRVHGWGCARWNLAAVTVAVLWACEAPTEPLVCPFEAGCALDDPAPFIDLTYLKATRPGPR